MEIVFLEERGELTRIEINREENVSECLLRKNRRITKQYWNIFVTVNHNLTVVSACTGALFSQ